ncbi:MAG: CotH kinase family protein, partial [bacterium]
IFLDIEQPDKRFLSTNGYSEDCNLYKMNRGWTVDGKIWEKETNNCSPEDDSDIQAFYSGYGRYRTDYLREHLDIEKYLSYRCILEAVHHYDVYAEKNYYYLNNVETGLWEVLPWDIDITFGSDHGDGHEPFRDMIVGNLSHAKRPRTGPYAMEFRNRLREVCQLLYNEEVLFPILDGARDSIVELAAADRDRWDNFTDPHSGRKEWERYQSLDERLDEMKAWIGKRIHQDYTDFSGNFVMSLERLCEDPDIPGQPRVLTPFDNEELIPGDLVLSSSSFSDPNPDSELAAVRWIVTRFAGNELRPDWSIEGTGDGAMTVSVPRDALSTSVIYRCRVRHQDQTSRWSLWSEPVTFTIRPDTGVANWREY